MTIIITLSLLYCKTLIHGIFLAEIVKPFFHSVNISRTLVCSKPDTGNLDKF